VTPQTVCQFGTLEKLLSELSVSFAIFLSNKLFDNA